MSMIFAAQVLGVVFAQWSAYADTGVAVGGPRVPKCACEVATRSSFEDVLPGVVVNTLDGAHALDGEAIRAALHLSGRDFDVRTTPEEAMTALTEGVMLAGVDRLREWGRRSQESERAHQRGTIGNAAHRRVMRELWGSTRRFDRLTFVKFALFQGLRDTLSQACSAHLSASVELVAA